MPPTIVLVHGAFAESASWNGVARRLRAAGPVVLVGHSYRVHDQFCADLPTAEAGLMAATQRPATAAPQRSLAERADAQRTVEMPGASHAVAVSHPDETADLVLEAARAGAAA
jgi:pimeloyl-ACP methyl ester carboxylesterase